MATKQKKSQRTEVLAYMKAHKCITDNIAHEKFGVCRMGSVIYDLRKKGYDIETVMIDGKNRFGNQTRYGKYYYRGVVNE